MKKKEIKNKDFSHAPIHLSSPLSLSLFQIYHGINLMLVDWFFFKLLSYFKRLLDWSFKVIGVILTKVQQISVTPHKETDGIHGSVNSTRADG